ncbi:MAG: hypothetical protein ACC628_22665 [Pirellulaceae bacterium]
MNSFVKSMFLVAWFGLVIAWGRTAEARHPAYLLLRGPSSSAPHHPTYGYYPGHPVQVETRAYSYGWFGVQPRRHWSRHTGYYGNFREWSAR